MDALKAGGTFHVDFKLWAFYFPRPQFGAGELCTAMLSSGGTGQGRAPQGAPTRGSGLKRPNLSFLACKTCVLLTYRNCMKQTRALFFPGFGQNWPAPVSPAIAAVLLPQWEGRQGPTGTRWHLQSTSLKPKTTPRGTTEKTMPRGKEKEPQGAIAACVSLFKALDSLCCCMISHPWFFGHLLRLPDTRDLPLRSLSVAANRV